MDAYFQLIDVFFRFATIGELVLIALVLIRRPLTFRSGLLLAIAPCLTGYLLLTAPFDELFVRDYRGPLLVLTELVPYLVWVLGMHVFDERFVPSKLPAWAWPVIGLYLLWHVYFFGMLEGRGLFHDVVEVLYLALFAHLIAVAVIGLNDDLVEPRRRARLLLLAFASLQLLVIVLAEIVPPTPAGAEVFDAVNAGLFFLLVSIVGAALAGPPPAALLQEPSAEEASEPAGLEARVAPADRRLYEDLMRFMQAGGYRQSSLTIGRLARELGTPEHRLRRLVNGTLGFRNFSTFLNGYRIREACGKLRDPELAGTPILTIALDLGYGSIGPFNRAFKALVGCTPSEYRAAAASRAPHGA